MTGNTMISTTPQSVVHDAVAIVDRYGPTPEAFAKIGEVLRNFAAQIDILEGSALKRLHTTGATATILAEGKDGRGALMLARFPAEAATPIHNHNTYGVTCVVKGRNRYERWGRFDDLSDPNRADVRLIEVIELGEGESTWFPPPPQDLHTQQGIGGPVWELIFFGQNPNREPRAYFDPATGEVTYGLPTDDPATNHRDD